jgi:hypothetical protein
MSPQNGQANGSGSSLLDTKQPALPTTLLGANTPPQFTPEQIRQFVDLLEAPFDASVVEWRVTNTSKKGGTLRGQVIPYADQRAIPTVWMRCSLQPAGPGSIPFTRAPIFSAARMKSLLPKCSSPVT